MKMFVPEVYRKINAVTDDNYLLELSKKFYLGAWIGHLARIHLCDVKIKGKTVLDFGCKFGLASPLFLDLGATEYIGVEAVGNYYREIEKSVQPILGERNASFMLVEDGYIELPDESVDFVYMNEVISHINPDIWYRTFRELGRILSQDGYLLISDGNNLACPKIRERLEKMYPVWENGPFDATEGASPFVELRKSTINEWFPDLSESRVEELALKTSGLYGEYFRERVERMLGDPEIQGRTYQPGQVPVHPESGIVMERGFYPQEIYWFLRAMNFEVRYLFPWGRSRISHSRVSAIEEKLRENDELRVYIFGSGPTGRKVFRMLEKFSSQIEGYLDNNPDLWGGEIDGCKVWAPHKILVQGGQNRFVVVASGASPVIERQLEMYGLQKGLDFDSVMQEAAIEQCSIDERLSQSGEFRILARKIIDEKGNSSGSSLETQ